MKPDYTFPILVRRDDGLDIVEKRTAFALTTPERLEQLRRDAEWGMRAHWIEHKVYELRCSSLRASRHHNQEEWEWVAYRYAAHYWERHK